MGPTPDSFSSHRKGTLETDRHTGKTSVKMKSEIGVTFHRPRHTRLPTKPPEARWGVA